MGGGCGQGAEHEGLDLALGAGDTPYPYFVDEAKELLACETAAVVADKGHVVVGDHVAIHGDLTVELAIEVEAEGGAVVNHCCMAAGEFVGRASAGGSGESAGGGELGVGAAEEVVDVGRGGMLGDEVDGAGVGGCVEAFHSELVANDVAVADLEIACIGRETEPSLGR